MKTTIEIRPVHTPKELDLFIRFPFQLYNGNSFWVPPQINEEKAFFDRIQNPVFKNAEACCFLAFKERKVVGRIAALVNHIEVDKLDSKKLRFGWFDFIDDMEVSQKLLATVQTWGKERSLEHMEGPMGFSNLDKAGMLTMGFEEKSTMITLYNYPYYPAHLEKLGFEIKMEWVEYEIKIPTLNNAPKKIERFADLIMERYQLKIIDFKTKSSILPYVEEMFALLDKTYSSLPTYVPIQDYQIDTYKKKYLPYINPELIKCIVNQKEELIAFSIILPSLSTALQKMKGKWNLASYYHLWKAINYNNRASFYLIGIRPDFQNKGITAVIFNKMQRVFNKRNIKWVETNPELKENKAIQMLWKNYEKRLHKTRVTYGKSI